MDRQKVFCVGFHKTGTSSLKDALKLLGYRVCNCRWWKEPNIGQKVHSLVDEAVPRFDAFQDNPWPVLFRYLDEKFPGNLFIMSTRSPESWINSVVKHFGTSDSPMRRWIYGEEYGVPQGNEQVYVERFLKHEAEVRDYFPGRRDFIEMPLCGGAGWEVLCPFLGVPIPADAFPASNNARDVRVRRWRKRASDAVSRIFGPRLHK